MLLRLKRSAPDGLAVRGELYLVTYNLLEEREIETLICPTLEHRDYLILPLYYRLTVTYSPRFKRPLPLVNDVPQSPPVPLKGEEKHPEERFRLRVSMRRRKIAVALKRRALPVPQANLEDASWCPTGRPRTASAS